MIKNLNFYHFVNNKIDKAGYEANNSLAPALICNIPKTIDISLKYVDIYFYGSDYSFRRTYSIEKVFASKTCSKKNGKKKEIFNRRAYRISFNNPRDKEHLYSGVVELNHWQNFLMYCTRILRWFRHKENLLWVTNIIVLIMTTLCSCCKCCR